MISLKHKWKAFFEIIFDPWILVFLISTVTLIVFQSNQTDKSISAILAVLISLSSAFLGGLIRKQWLDITEESVLIARGKSAIRSLKLLLGNVASVERRVCQYKERYAKQKQEAELIKICLEEIVEKCIVLEEEVLNSIENWTDIIPEADIKTQIGVISELKQSIESLMKDIDGLKTELETTREKSRGESEALSKKILEKERQLSDAQAALDKQRRHVFGEIGSLTNVSSISAFAPITHSVLGPLMITCQECRKEYGFDSIFSDDMRCTECRKKSSM